MGGGGALHERRDARPRRARRLAQSVGAKVRRRGRLVLLLLLAVNVLGGGVRAAGGAPHHRPRPAAHRVIRLSGRNRAPVFKVLHVRAERFHHSQLQREQHASQLSTLSRRSRRNNPKHRHLHRTRDVRQRRNGDGCVTRGKRDRSRRGKKTENTVVGDNREESEHAHRHAQREKDENQGERTIIIHPFAQPKKPTTTTTTSTITHSHTTFNEVCSAAREKEQPPPAFTERETMLRLLSERPRTDSNNSSCSLFSSSHSLRNAPLHTSPSLSAPTPSRLPVTVLINGTFPL